MNQRVSEKWPVDYITWKGLKGDPTDNIPGIKGVGAKTATKLSQNPDDLETFLNKKPGRREVFESAKRQIRLVDIQRSCSKWENEEYQFDETNLFNEFKKREFKTIIGNAWPKWVKTLERIS